MKIEYKVGNADEVTITQKKTVKNDNKKRTSKARWKRKLEAKNNLLGVLWRFDGGGREKFAYGAARDEIRNLRSVEEFRRRNVQVETPSTESSNDTPRNIKYIPNKTQSKPTETR